MEVNFDLLYNEGNDCDSCYNQYLCGLDGDSLGCRCFDYGEPCIYIPEEDML